MSDQQMVGLQGLATHLKVHANTVRSWVKSGRIPPSTYIHINHTRRFFLHEVLEALRSERVMEVKDPKQLELPLGIAAHNNEDK